MSVKAIISEFDKARELIGKARVEECLDLIEEVLEDNKDCFDLESQYGAVSDELITLRFRHSQIQKQKHLGENVDVIQNHFINAILVFIRLLEEEIEFQKHEEKSQLFVEENRVTLSIKIEGDFDSFDEERQKALKEQIVNILNLNPSELIVRNIKSGSVILEIELTFVKVMQLKSLVKLGLLREQVMSVTVANQAFDEYSNLSVEQGMLLSHANLTETNLKSADLTGADLTNANLTGANLIRANLFKANLIKTDFRRTKLNGANLSGANLIGANFIGADLFGANLSGANLFRATLIRAYFFMANLSGSNLSGANFFNANLSNANLSGANLSGIDLSVADITGADFSEADLTGTIALVSQSLTLKSNGADISKMKFIDDESKKEVFEDAWR